MPTEIWKIGTENLDVALPLATPLLEAICVRGYSSMEGFKARFASGESQLWIIGEGGEALAVVVTDIQEYPGFKACRITQCTGRDRKRWIHHLDDIKAWAQSVGCGKMQAVARPGWASELKEFKKTHLILECDL